MADRYQIQKKNITWRLLRIKIPKKTTQIVSFELKPPPKTLVDYHRIGRPIWHHPFLLSGTWGLQKLRCHALKPPMISSVA